MSVNADIDRLAAAIDALVGIQPRKTAITDPQLLALLRIAHLRRHIARTRFPMTAEAALILWQRLAPVLAGSD